MSDLISMWTLRRRQKGKALSIEANDLARAYGFHAYPEALRRRFQANSLSEIWYLCRVRPELSLRTVERLDDPRNLANLGVRVCDNLGIDVESRAQARVLARALARMIESVRTGDIEHPAGARAELHSALSARSAALEITKTESRKSPIIFDRDALASTLQNGLLTRIRPRHRQDLKSPPRGLIPRRGLQ